MNNFIFILVICKVTHSSNYFGVHKNVKQIHTQLDL